MKLWHVVAIAAGAFVIGALVCRPDASLARAEAQRDSLKVVADSLRARDEERAVADAFAADSNRRRDAALDSLKRLGDSIAALVGGLEAQLRAMPGAMVPRELVNRIIAGKNQEIGAAVARGDTLRAMLLTARRLRTDDSTAAVRWRDLAEMRGTALDAALKHRRWGCVVGAGGTLGPSIAGSSASLFGGSIGVSFVCGRKVL